MSDKKRTTVTTIETHEVWIIRRATVPELPDEGALTTLAFQPCHHVAQPERLANQGHAVRRQHAHSVHAEVRAEGSNQLKKSKNRRRST